MSNYGDWLDSSNNANKIKQTYVQGFVDISGGNVVVRTGNVYLNRSLFVLQDTSFNANIYVNGTSTMNQDVSMNANARVTGNLTVLYDSSLNGNVYINKLSTMNGDVSMNANVVVGGNSRVNGLMTVLSDSSLNGNVYINKLSTMNGDVSMNASVVVGGNSRVNVNLTVLSDSSLNGNVYINKLSTMNGDVSMNASVVVGGNSRVNGQMTVLSDSSLNGNVYINKLSTMNGDVSMNANVVVGGNSKVGGNLTVLYDSFSNGNVYINKLSTMNGDVSMNANVVVGGNSTVGGNLFVIQDVSLNANIAIRGNAMIGRDVYTLNGNVYSSYFDTCSNVIHFGAGNFNKRINIGQDNTVGSNIYIGGNADIVTIRGNVSNSINYLSVLNGNIVLNGNSAVQNKSAGVGINICDNGNKNAGFMKIASDMSGYLFKVPNSGTVVKMDIGNLYIGTSTINDNPNFPNNYSTSTKSILTIQIPTDALPDASCVIRATNDIGDFLVRNSERSTDNRNSQQVDSSLNVLGRIAVGMGNNGLNNYKAAVMDISGNVRIQGNSFLMGNTGFGTTTPQYFVDICGNTRVQGNSFLMGNTGFGTVTPQYFVDIRGNTYILGSVIADGQLGVNTTPYQSYKLSVSGDTYLYGNTILTNGNIGINNPNPSYHLEISGNTCVQGNTFLMGNTGFGTVTPQYFVDIVGNTRVQGNSFLMGNTGFGTVTPQYFVDIVGNTRVQGNSFLMGNTGFGTVTPQYFVDIVGNKRVQGNSFLMGNTGFGTVTPQYFVDIVGNTRVQGNSFLMGNTGFGTVTPQYFVDISGNTRVQGNSFLMGNTGFGTVTPQYFVDISGNTRVQGNSFLMGNVGVNKLIPAFTFDVNGNINLSGNLYQNGSLYKASQWVTSSTDPNNTYYPNNPNNTIIGNVGINTEPKYNYQLDVVGNVRLSSTQISQNDFVGLATIGISSGYVDAQVTDVIDSTITYQVYTFTNTSNTGVSTNTIKMPMDTKIGFIVIGGGGGGGSSTATQCGTGGGGGGIQYNKWSSSTITLTANTTYNISVGNGGTANTSGAASSIGSLISANGGSGGTLTASTIAGGAGGSGTGGTPIVGGRGGGSDTGITDDAQTSTGAQIDIYSLSYYTSGGGGSGTGTASLGASGASNNPATGLGSNVIGTTGTSISSAGGNSSAIGGGGGGAARGAVAVGGTGGPGIVIIYFKVPGKYKNSAIHLDTYLKTLPASSICAIDNGFGSNDMTFNTTPYTNVSGQNVERLRIKDNGYIGIGTTAPAYPLDVSGNTRINRGALYISNSRSYNTDAPDTGPDVSGGIKITSDKTGSTPYAMNIGVDYTSGSGYINCAGNGIFQPVILNSRGGNVGIGTSTPIVTMDVSGQVRIGNKNSVSITHPIEICDGAFDGGTAYGALNITRLSSDYTRAHIAMIKSGITLWQLGITNTSSNFGIWTNNYASNTGNTPLLSLTTTGQLSTTSFNASSDYRIKENVEELDEKFTVNRLRPVHYYNKSLQKQDIGFIAHEVQEHFPYLVTGEKDGKDMQSLNYTGLIGILVKEIQDLKKVVSEQQKLVDDIIKRLG